MGKRGKSRKKRNRNRHSKGSQKFYTKEDIFLSRLASIMKVSPKQARSYFSQRIISVIRLNNLMEDPEKIKTHLEEKGLDLEAIRWSPLTYIVRNKDKSELGTMRTYKQGLFYIQGLSSMIPVVELDVNEQDKVLDMCAAPGSKTTMLASMMNNKGEIVANEEEYKRVQRLKSVLEQFGIKNTKVKSGDGRDLGTEKQNYFNKILLDVPCSGEGLIYLNGPKPLRFWSIKKVERFSKIQSELLHSAFQALKPGGTIVYSTCTLEPSENEGVISQLLQDQPTASLLELDIVKKQSFKDYLPYTAPGIKKWSGQKYHPEMDKTLRVIPGRYMQGFYIAKIGKNAD